MREPLHEPASPRPPAASPSRLLPLAGQSNHALARYAARRVLARNGDPVKLYDVTGANVEQVFQQSGLAPVEEPIGTTPWEIWGSQAAKRKVADNDLGDQLAVALQTGVDVTVVSLVFETLSPSQLEKLPDQSDDGTWVKLGRAATFLERFGGFEKWLKIGKLAVKDIASFEMLMSDKGTAAGYQTGQRVVGGATPLPSFKGRPYEEIAGVLTQMGYRRAERYDESRGHDTPYGQDVWTHDNHLVVRIKVGGRSLQGRFQRPPHVVKEISRTPHAYSPADIVCKLTDDNHLIPAGTKFSARDMQTWYEKVLGKDEITRRGLKPTDWKTPSESADPDFRQLIEMWAEGAHTPIDPDDVPRL